VRWSEEVSGVQGTVSKKLKHATVNLVGPRLGGDVDNATGGVSVLRAQIFGLEIEFLDGIGVRERQVQIQVSVIVPSSIELVVHLTESSSVDVGQLLSRIDPAVAQAADLVHVDSPRPKVEKGLSPPAVEREIYDPFLVDQLTYSGGPGSDQVNIRIHHDIFGDFSHS
jgi:hypothetical protein